MCGLVFTTRTCDQSSAPWREAMQILACRGPDSLGELHSASLSAGHCRLAVIGLGPAGHQPYSLDSSEDLLVYNGEIYNYREIAARYDLAADSDTQVLYHLLRQGHVERLSELRGMFAFVYWRRDPETIVVARDMFGIKPLFVAQGGDGSLSFASTASVLATLEPQAAADSVAIAGFLATGYIPSQRSAFSGVAKCPEGVATTWSRDGGSWQARETPLSLDPWPSLPPQQAVADSVRAHLVSDVPVGVLLSGGVDSTLLAALAAQQVDELHTYSLTNPLNPAIDESEFARWNAALLHSRHTEVPFDPSTAMAAATALVRSSGEPFGDPAFVPLAALCERVSADLKVVLAGEGADELFGGYRRYDVERRRAAGVTRVPTRVLGHLLGGTAAYRRLAPSQRVRAWAALSESDDLLAHSYLLGAEWDAVAVALPRATRTALTTSARAWAQLPESPRRLGRPVYQAFDLTQWLPNVFLEKSDRASMLHGVEVRVPYLDPVVAKAASTVTANESDKRPLRQALTAVLPGVRLPTRKMGLSVDTVGLIHTSGMAESIRFELQDRYSLLRSMEAGDTARVAERARANPALAFRIGMLGIWEREFHARS